MLPEMAGAAGTECLAEISPQRIAGAQGNAITLHYILVKRQN